LSYQADTENASLHLLTQENSELTACDDHLSQESSVRVIVYWFFTNSI